MDPDVKYQNWQEIKQEVRRVWSNIASDELDEHRDNPATLVELIQERYGHTKDAVAVKLNEILEPFGQSTEDIKTLKGSAVEREYNKPSDRLHSTL